MWVKVFCSVVPNPSGWLQQVDSSDADWGSLRPLGSEGDSMSRLLWLGIGAAGGIYTYRRGQRVWDRAKERGWGGSATLVASATMSAIQTVRVGMLEQQLASAQSANAATNSGDLNRLAATDDAAAPELVPPSRSYQSRRTVTLG